MVLQFSSSNGNFSLAPTRILSKDDLLFIQEWTRHQYTDAELTNNILEIHEQVRSKYHVYRCISTLSHLVPRAKYHPVYSECVTALTTDPSKKILDLGTCFGQEVRVLIADNVSPSQIYATDVTSVYWEAGKELFLDISTTSPLISSNRHVEDVHTLWGDWAVPITFPLPPDDIAYPFVESFDYIMSWAVFHVLSKDQGKAMLQRIYTMLKPQGVLFGVCVGAKHAQNWLLTPNNTATRYLHNVESFTTMCEEVGFTKELIDVILIERDLLPPEAKTRWDALEQSTASVMHSATTSTTPKEKEENIIRLAFTLRKA